MSSIIGEYTAALARHPCKGIWMMPTCLGGAPNQLPDYFRYREQRTVSNDRTVRLAGRLYQVPLGLAGKRVELRYETLDRVELFVDGASKGFVSEVPLHANSRIGRIGEGTTQPATAKSGSLFSGGRS
jgi:hypothetical protein